MFLFQFFWNVCCEWLLFERRMWNDVIFVKCSYCFDWLLLGLCLEQDEDTSQIQMINGRIITLAVGYENYCCNLPRRCFSFTYVVCKSNVSSGFRYFHSRHDKTWNNATYIKAIYICEYIYMKFVFPYS